MANMSYCRFENTYADFVDCAKALEDIVNYGDSISEKEWAFAKRLRNWCDTFCEVFDEIDEEELNVN